MKTTTCGTVGAVGLVEWLKPSSPRYSLALGATCGCDITRLGEDIRNHLNRGDPPAGGHFRVFDPEEIRQLAGDPFWRQSVLAAAGRHGPEAEFRCDYENLIRALATLGGAVLPGQAAIEATADLDNVFRVALSHCDRCLPETTLSLDPAGFSEAGLATVIGKRFLRWCEGKSRGDRPREVAGARVHAVS